MKDWLKPIQAWRSKRQHRRQQRLLERWERVRAKGKTRFVLRIALQFMLLPALNCAILSLIEGENKQFL